MTANSGRECLEKIEKEKPDLVLLDIVMPDMSGWDVYGRIKKNSSDTKVMFVSVVEISQERRETLIREGLSDYITKPFTKDELVKKVKSVIRS